jgi:hypothetical protein
LVPYRGAEAMSYCMRIPCTCGACEKAEPTTGVRPYEPPRRATDVGARDRARAAWVRVVLDRVVDWLADLERAGLVKVRVTAAGLASVAKDGLVRVDGVDHVQDCDVVKAAARGHHETSCSCGSVPP